MALIHVMFSWGKRIWPIPIVILLLGLLAHDVYEPGTVWASYVYIGGIVFLLTLVFRKAWLALLLLAGFTAGMLFIYNSTRTFYAVPKQVSIDVEDFSGLRVTSISAGSDPTKWNPPRAYAFVDAVVVRGQDATARLCTQGKVFVGSCDWPESNWVYPFSILSSEPSALNAISVHFQALGAEFTKPFTFAPKRFTCQYILEELSDCISHELQSTTEATIRIEGGPLLVAPLVGSNYQVELPMSQNSQLGIHNPYSKDYIVQDAQNVLHCWQLQIPSEEGGAPIWRISFTSPAILMLGKRGQVVIDGIASTELRDPFFVLVINPDLNWSSFLHISSVNLDLVVNVDRETEMPFPVLGVSWPDLSKHNEYLFTFITGKRGTVAMPGVKYTFRKMDWVSIYSADFDLLPIVADTHTYSIISNCYGLSINNHFIKSPTLWEAIPPAFRTIAITCVSSLFVALVGLITVSYTRKIREDN